METLLRTTRDHLSKNFPLVLYALPGNNVVHALFQKNGEVHQSVDFTEEGFVFAPFSEEPALFIPEEESRVEQGIISEKITPVSFPSEENDSEKKSYLTLVDRAIQLISEGGAQKIVTSRCKKIAIPDMNLSMLVSRLFKLYPDAFRYIWHHPESGTWCGATPEILMQTEGKKFNTMALAGTQPFSEDTKPNWTSKELSEQKWVVDAITKQLDPIASVLKISKTKNHRAGSLMHLRTDFEGIYGKGMAGLARMAKALHPTPAVCGTPRKATREFILANENYDRSFYTGFLGPINTPATQSRLYVNLRCMKLDEHAAHLFVGGGITIDSQPETEWEETQQKLQTMLQVLAPMLSNCD